MQDYWHVRSEQNKQIYRDAYMFFKSETKWRNLLWHNSEVTTDLAHNGFVQVGWRAYICACVTGQWYQSVDRLREFEDIMIIYYTAWQVMATIY